MFIQQEQIWYFVIGLHAELSVEDWYYWIAISQWPDLPDKTDIQLIRYSILWLFLCVTGLDKVP